MPMIVFWNISNFKISYFRGKVIAGVKILSTLAERQEKSVWHSGSSYTVDIAADVSCEAAAIL